MKEEREAVFLSEIRTLINGFIAIDEEESEGELFINLDDHPHLKGGTCSCYIEDVLVEYEYGTKVGEEMQSFEPEIFEG